MHDRKTSLTIVPDFIDNNDACRIIDLISKNSNNFASDKTEDGRQVSQDNLTPGNMGWKEAPTKLRNGSSYYIPTFSENPEPVEGNGFLVNYREDGELWSLTDNCVNAISEYIKNLFDIKELSCMAAMLRQGGINANIPPHQDGPMLNGGVWTDIDFSCFIILNNDFSGGSIRFEELGISWEPVARSAVFLCNTSTKEMVHEIQKVTSGERYSINTFWTAS